MANTTRYLTPHNSLNGTPRRRGCPPTNGDYVELAKTQREANEEQESALKIWAEKELFEDLRRKDAELRDHGDGGTDNATSVPGKARGEDWTSAGLAQKALLHLEKVELVAQKFKNLRDTFVRDLRGAALEVRRVVETLISRDANEEVRTLREENQRLQGEISDLRKEVIKLQRKLMAPSAHTECPRPEGCLPRNIGRQTDERDPDAPNSGQEGLVPDAFFSTIMEKMTTYMKVTYIS